MDNFVYQATTIKNLFLVSLGPVAYICINCSISSVLVKGTVTCKYLGSFAKYAEWNCLHWLNKHNHVNLQTDLHCGSPPNTLSETVHLGLICGMKLFVFIKYAKQNCVYLPNKQNCLTSHILSSFLIKTKKFLRGQWEA